MRTAKPHIPKNKKRGSVRQSGSTKAVFGSLSFSPYEMAGFLSCVIFLPPSFPFLIEVFRVKRENKKNSKEDKLEVRSK